MTTNSSTNTGGNQRLLLLTAGGLVLLAIACGGLIVREAVTQPSGDSTPVELPEGVGVDPQIGRAIPLDLQFRDAQGREVELSDYFRKKPILLAPVYYECPMLCNLVMDGLVRSLRTLEHDVGRDFDVVIVSFDPRETPELAAGAKETTLRRYDRPGTADGWHFLTGQEEPIRQLTDSLGFHYRYNPDTGRYAHAAGLFLLTPDGRVARFFSGIEYSARDVQRLAKSSVATTGLEFSRRDLRLGLAETSQQELASTADQVLLLCYHYDPTRGRYGLAIMNLIRVAGGLTVALMAVGFLWLFGRERSAPRSRAEKARRDAVPPETPMNTSSTS
ncbi:MAG: SCO family protein [Pirellulaceae bacterium]